MSTIPASPSLSEWEARTEHDVGLLIRQYLTQHPSPGPSLLAEDLREWAGLLEADGQSRLASGGLRRLRVLGGVAA